MTNFNRKQIYASISLVILFSTGIIASMCTESKIKFTWECDSTSYTCIKKLANDTPKECIQSFKVCNLLCGSSSIIWPKPIYSLIEGPPLHISSVSFEDNIVTMNSETHSQCVKQLLTEAINIFMDRVKKENVTNIKSEMNSYVIKVSIDIRNTEVTDLTLKTDESYQLTLQKSSSEANIINVLIEGETFFGIRHGLETLSQLIVYDNVNKGLVVPNKVKIMDYPKYPFRGLMLDTARNYISVKGIKRTIDAMAANKLNRFHWHITDTHSFPMKLERYKTFAEYGAYSEEKVYTEEDIKLLTDYAKVRGVRIIPELDAPAHTGEGWQTVPDALTCFNMEPWSMFCAEPPCGQLNPLSDTVYETLEGLYEEYLKLFQTDLFHMGGDEVSISCWKASVEIYDWFRSKSNETEAFYELWNGFQTKAFNKLMEASKTAATIQPEVILWTSKLTDQSNLAELKVNNYIIQVWGSINEKHSIRDLLEYDFRIILSNSDTLYLDCGYASWVNADVNWCSPYKTWPKIYSNSLHNMKIPKEKRHLILGQEVALWTETATEESLDLRLWPRAAALAERTWSDPNSDWKDAESRMLYHRDRLVQLGIGADAVEPEWCMINKGGCATYDPHISEFIPNEVTLELIFSEKNFKDSKNFTNGLSFRKKNEESRRSLWHGLK